jgi:transcriptional regulator with XRE-family HTH domain/SOS-response transcriptional repressor LexA
MLPVTLPGDFAKILREARQKAGLSQAALGERAGLTAPYISLLESGRRRPPSPHQVERLARALALDPAPWLEQAALERTPQPIRRRLEGLDKERGKVSRARDRILTTTLFRVSRTPGLLEGMGESPEETGSFGQLMQLLTARLRGVRSAREADDRRAEILARVSPRERDRLIERLPEMLGGTAEAAPAAADTPTAAPLTVALEVRAGLAADALVLDVTHVDARWGPSGAFLWRLEGDEGWPRLESGDLLLVDPAAAPGDGDLVAVRHGGRDLVRTLRRRGDDEVRLEALRPEVAPLRLASGEFRPAGTVTHVLRSLR